jgi:hypothetical protein
VSCDTSTRLGNPDVKVVFLTEQYPPVIRDGVGTYTAIIARRSLTSVMRFTSSPVADGD